MQSVYFYTFKFTINVQSIYNSSQWFSLNYTFVEYVLHLSPEGHRYQHRASDVNAFTLVVTLTLFVSINITSNTSFSIPVSKA